MEHAFRPEATEQKRDDLTDLLLGDRLLSDAEEAAIYQKVEQGESIVPSETLNEIIRDFQTPDTIDPMVSIELFARGSAEGAALMRTDLKLPRDCRHFEHIYAVVNGADDFISLLNTAEERAISRFTAFAQDIFKPVTVKATGSNIEQAAYNAIGIDNLLPGIDDSLLASDAKETVRQLINQDFIGGALQGRFDSRKFDEFKAGFPERFQSRLGTFMMIAYLADAGAHTIHRSYPDLENNRELRCCIPEDHDVEGKSLSQLFTRIPDGPLALRHPYRDVLAGMFPKSDLAHYFAQNHDAQPETRNIESTYQETAEAGGIWSAEMRLPNIPPAQVIEAITEFAKDTRFPISTYLTTGRGVVTHLEFVRDPSRRRQPSAPAPDECQVQAEAFSQRFNWPLVEKAELAPARPDVRACVGLLEGYDEDQIKHPPAEALALLLKRAGEDIAIKTKVVTLVSAAYFFDEQAGQEVVKPYTERLMIVETTAKRTGIDPLSVITHVAGNLRQQRIFAELKSANRTVALGRVIN